MQRYRLYDRFAPIYERYWGDYFLEDAKEAIADVFLPRLPPGGRVLDLCCGTGQTAAWLAACGFRVVGLDGSEQMLGFARERAPDAELVCADARSFELAAPVDGALATFDSMNHLPAATDVQAAVHCVFRALEPGGWFLFDINAEEGFEYAAGESYSVREAGRVAVVTSEYDPASKRGVSRITLFEPARGDLWTREDLEIPEYCHPTAVFTGALAAAGFSEPLLYDATEDFEMPKAEGRLFFLAQRPEA